MHGLEGFELLKELVAVDPNNGMALLMLGDMQMQSGDSKNGLQNLKAAIKSDGPSIDQKMNILIALQGQAVNAGSVFPAAGPTQLNDITYYNM